MLISKSPAPLQQFNISGTRSHNGQGPWRRQRYSRYLILSGSAVFDEQFTSHFGTTMTKDTIEGIRSYKFTAMISATSVPTGTWIRAEISNNVN
jgi:hypothetical protein